MDSLPHPVALVEDDEAFVVALRRLLTAFGIATESFSSAEQFLASIRSHRFSCLLLDIHLPGKSGLDLLDCLARENLRLPVILMTAQDSAAVRDRASRFPVMGLLQKPVEGTMLVRLIHQVLHSEPSPVRNPETPVPVPLHS